MERIEDGTSVAEDKVHLLEQVNDILKTSYHETKVTAKPQDISHLRKELKAIIKHNLGPKMIFFIKTVLVWSIQVSTTSQIVV